MGGGGFEPPKQIAADLQSVPFGHSGIHPFCLSTISIYIINKRKAQGNLSNSPALFPNFYTQNDHAAFIWFIIVFRSHFLRLLILLFGSLISTLPSSVNPERTIKCPWFVKSPGPILQMIGCPAESSDLRVSSDQFVSCAEFIPSSEAPAVISVQSVPTSST